MKTVEFELDGKKVIGVEVPLPKAPLVLVHGKNGFVMCGYLNTEVAEKLGVAAARVRGVNTVDDVLKAKVENVSAEAQKLGVKVGMTGREAISRLS